MAVVLIVEDEEQVRVLAEAIIAELGHETLTAATAEQALALVRERPDIDLLFHRHRIAAGPGSRPATGQGHQRSKTETARALHHRPGGDRRHAGIVCRAFWFPPQAVHAPGFEDGAGQSLGRLGTAARANQARRLSAGCRRRPCAAAWSVAPPRSGCRTPRHSGSIARPSGSRSPRSPDRA